MIGSLIYYGLYPLTQLFIKLSESWWKRRLVIINGTPVCDGADSCRRLNDQQPALLDQWCNTRTEASETPTHTLQERRRVEGLVEGRSLLDIREVVVEQESKMEDDDKEKIHSEDLLDPNPESVIERKVVSVSEWANIQTAADDSNWRSNGGLFSCQAASFGTLTQADPDNRDIFISPQQNFPNYQACSNQTEYFKPTADGAEVSENAFTIPVQLTSGQFTSKNVYGGVLGARESEAQVNNASLAYDLSVLLADDHAQPFINHTWTQPVSTAWDFPLGLGLSEVVDNPLHFPGASYYHGFQENTNCEVIWRVWEDLSETPSHCISPHTACVDSETKFDFTVMSYNILAQDLLEANSELYAHCSEDVMAWENRLQNIFKDLQMWEPDIICLQEVQENHFQEQMHPALIEMGYDCVYKRRTGNKTDGCAVCYNSKRFTSLSVHLLEFQRHDCELLDRDNVGIVLLLQPTTEHGEIIQGRPICVANTHLLFNPRRGDVKLAQLAIVLAEIDSVVKKCDVKGHECEIILCGDFNSLPNMPLYQLIVTGLLYYHGLPNWMVSGQEDLSYKTYHRRLYAPLWPSSLGISDNCQYYDVCDHQAKESGKLQYNHDFLRQLRYCPAACVRPPDLVLIRGVTDNTPTPEEPPLSPPRHFRNTICHGLNLRSVYSHHLSDTERSAVTTLHSHGAAMVDYIFYSTGRRHAGGCDDKQKGLKLLGRLALLSEADLWSLNGLPNEIFPSDHLSLLAKFQLC